MIVLIDKLINIVIITVIRGLETILNNVNSMLIFDRCKKFIGSMTSPNHQIYSHEKNLSCDFTHLTLNK